MRAKSSSALQHRDPTEAPPGLGRRQPSDALELLCAPRKGPGADAVQSAAAPDLTPRASHAPWSFWACLAVVALACGGCGHLFFPWRYSQRMPTLLNWQVQLLSLQLAGQPEIKLGISDSIYRGRGDFGYRISIGDLPFVTSIFPLRGQAGTPVAIKMSGWNPDSARAAEHDLPSTGRTLEPPCDSAELASPAPDAGPGSHCRGFPRNLDFSPTNRNSEAPTLRAL